MQKLIRASFLVLVLLVVTDVFSDSNGPSGGYTGAPSEGNCTTCHATYSLQTSGAKYDKIKLESNFTGNGYLPDSTYTIKISYKETGKTRYGFQLTALDVATNSAAGTFSTTDTRTQTGTVTVASKTRYFIEHTKTGTATVATDSTAWFIKWKAPNKQVGKIRFYINFNVADGNNNDNNDYIYKKSWDLDPSTLLPTASIKIKDSILCSGKALQFLGSGTQSPSSYSWTFTGGNITSSNSQNPLVTFSSTGNYYAVLTVKNSKGTSLADTLRFKIVAGAVKPTLTVPTAVSVCSGDSTKLAVNAITGHTMSWFPADNKKSAIFVKDSGVYYAVSTNSVGCTRNSDNVKVSLLRKPEGVIFTKSKDTTFCLNTSFQVGVKNKFAPILDSLSYLSNKTGFVLDSTFSQTFVTAGTKNIAAWLKTKEGCVSSAMLLKVAILDSVNAPTVSASDIQYTSIKFTWANQINSRFEYSIDGGKIWQLSNNNGQDTSVIVTTPTGNYLVNFWLRGIVLDRCGKTKNAQLSVRSKACSPINFDVSINPVSKSCKDSILNLQLNAPGISNYRWAVGKDTFDNKSAVKWKLSAKNNAIHFGLMDMTATICGYTEKTINWIGEEPPVFPLLFSGDSVFCRSDKDAKIGLGVKFLSPVKKNVIYSYFDTISLGYQDSLFQVSLGVNGNHPEVYVIAESDSGCVAKNTLLGLEVKGLPVVSLTQTNLGDYQYSWIMGSANATQFEWVIEGVNYSGKAVGPFDYYNYRGKYVHVMARVTEPGDGCVMAISDSFLIDVLSIKKWENRNQLNLHPNPIRMGDKLTLDFGSILGASVTTGMRVEVKFRDAAGRLVLEAAEEVVGGKLLLNTDKLVAGVYQVEVAMVAGTGRGLSSHTKAATASWLKLVVLQR